MLGIPFDSGTTYRPGTRFGPQGIRRISALYTPYNYELGVDLREQMTLCDAGDVFTIPANLEKSFDQITRGVAHVFSSGALPLMLGGDHSIGFPCVRGIAQCTSKRIGIIHFDRHIDIQEKDLDERMHTTPWYWATNLPNVPATNLVQLGIGGWQVPRDGVQEARKRDTNVLTIDDIEKLGLEKTAEIALELAWKDADAVYISFDVDSVDCGFVPGTGWPEPGGFLPREALKLLGLVAARGHLRPRGGRGLAALRHLRHHRAGRRARRRRGARLDGRARQARRPQGDHRQAGQLLRRSSMHRGLEHDHLEHGHGGGASATTSAGRRPSTITTVRVPRPAGAVADAASRRAQAHGADARPRRARSRPGRGGLRRGFASATDPTSFLRLAHVPFEAVAARRREARAAAGRGRRRHRRRRVTPHLGGAAFRYDPLPARMVSRRQRLRFVYFDGAQAARARPRAR